MTQPSLVLVHSPLVGPLTWEPVAERLRRAGRVVVVPSLAGVIDGGPPYYRRLAERVANEVDGARAGSRVMLVGHSGAGALLPAVAEAIAGRSEAIAGQDGDGAAPGEDGTGPGTVCGAILVDAILPHPGQTWFETAPVSLGEHLVGLARDGRLPRWSEWFPAEAVSELLPDAGLRERFVADLPELPLAYLYEIAPQVACWPPARCAYLRLSEPYDEFADEAGRLGWPVHRENADHLATLTKPDRMAAILDQVAG
ncbi:MAG: alpha/beta fold hydrolase [Streptosporangiaceae bacterium]